MSIKALVPFRRRRWWADTNGIVGFASIGVCITGLVAWWPLAIAGGAGWVTLALLEAYRQIGALEHLKRAIRTHDRFEGLAGVKGTLDQIEFEIEDHPDKFVVHVFLPSHCRHLVIRPGRGETGDPAFDHAYRAGDADSWRVALTPAARALILETFDGLQFSLAAKRMQLTLRDEDSTGPLLEHLLRTLVALARDFGDRLALADREAAVFDLIAAEPFPVTRQGHYAWLISRNYQVPRILLAASTDRDPDVRAWAAAQRPPEQVYR